MLFFHKIFIILFEHTFSIFCMLKDNCIHIEYTYNHEYLIPITVPALPGYIGWRNQVLGIDSWDP
jgi:hypothetical protein